MNIEIFGIDLKSGNKHRIKFNVYDPRTTICIINHEQNKNAYGTND